MKTPKITAQNTMANFKNTYGFLRQDALSSEVLIKARKYTPNKAQYFRPTELIMQPVRNNAMVGTKFDHFFG